MNNQTYHKNQSVRKRFGQVFLKDSFFIKSIVELINPQKDQIIVEIGPGRAALTEPIGKLLDKLTVIELDRNLVKYLKEHSFLGKKLIIYQKDAMNINFSKLAKEIGQPMRIFGNLPYNISIPLVFHMLKYSDFISDMHFMLQKEVVNRLVAKPNSKAYSRLSVMGQYFCDIIPILEVPPSAFKPQPKVSSTVVRLTRHKKELYSVQNIESLRRITIEAFNQRRKIIRNSLGNFFTVDFLLKLDIDPTMRAENVSIEQYCKLANYINSDFLLKKNQVF